MELVEGATLAERLRCGPLGEGEALDLATRLLVTLRAVHEAGLVHRDVKPNNIVLESDGGVRLVDFGFATPIERVNGRRDAAGTPGYAAPEQFRTPTRLDGRTDLYALGNVLLESLTAPLGGPHRPPEGPLFDELTALGVRPELAPILAGLLAEDPDERYPDVHAVLRELEGVRAGRRALGPAAYEPSRHQAPLVGRDAELAGLTRAWLDDGTSSGSVVLLLGARGGGKTRLLAACAAKARDRGGRRVLEAKCRDGDPPLATLRRLFEMYVASLRRGTPAERAAGEEALRGAAGDRLTPFATLIAPILSEVLGADRAAEAASDGFPEGAAELLVQLARRAGPLLLCIDDLQWIDPVSREAILRLAERAHEAPIALVLAARSGASPVIDRLLALDRRRAGAIELAPLGEPQIAALIASHLGQAKAEPALVRRIAALADGTPMGVFEVLGAFLDAGALRPHAGRWRLDGARAERVALPAGALALLGHRLGELPPATRRVLEAAALLGTSFDCELLSRIVGLDPGDLSYAIDDATRAGLVESDTRNRHRFVHDSLPEMLVGALNAPAQKRLHQRIAELLDEGDGASFEALCASALHYAAGEIEKTPARAYRTARAAAEEALKRFDNETTLRFLELARTSANTAGLVLDTDYYVSLGEAQLRLGALAESLGAFEQALGRAHDPRIRATILGRIGWVHQTGADPGRAWTALARAFDAIGARMPVETARSAANMLGQLTRAGILKLSRRGSVGGQARAEIELLCDLHYQNARLGMEYGKPLRFVQSTLEALKLSEALGPSRAQARARASYGVVLTALGRRAAGAREVEGAQRMASELADPITLAFCVQMRALSACFGGEFDRALELLRECADVHGPWFELNEYCHNGMNGDFIESLRGRPTEAWAWIARVLGRLRRSSRTTEAVSDYVLHRAQAALTSLGRDATHDPWLAARLKTLPARQDRRESFYTLLSWGPRARLYVESGNIGHSFEALVCEFEAEGHNPRSVHPIVSEYYIAVAHARLHQCLRARPSHRAPHVARLCKALHDLGAVAKVPLYRAHCLVIQGSVAWLGGSLRKARQRLAEAEALAEKETCPWVLYAIARVRAHMLRDEGRLEAARAQARFAEMLAREHGAEPRALWVREEFALQRPAPSPQRQSTSSSSRSSRKARRQLSALLHTVRMPSSGLQPTEQAATILDDLLRDVDAERGLILFQPDPANQKELFVGRDRQGKTWSDTEGWREALIRSVSKKGEAWPSEKGQPPDAGEGVDRQRVLALPLFLYEQVVGALCLERGKEVPPFAQDDRELLLVLSHQVPIALELARVLVEREQLQTSLQQAHKMEVVGQLAGGVAHDFNNMLMTIQASLEFLGERAGLDREVNDELKIISGASQRAAQLTRQLLAFSRHQPSPMAPFPINDVLSELGPLLRRLAGERIRLEMALDLTVRMAKGVRTSFEQVMVNLVVNARDAMPEGGSLKITTRNAVLDETALRRGAPKIGEYVAIDVSDTGHGISPELVSRVFDPFFTTKPSGGGTGLGLTTVYAFVKNCGGHIELSSAVGLGTTFSLFLPKADSKSAERHPTSLPPRAPAGAETILVVDDDRLVRRTIGRILERGGYKVLTAGDSTDALDLVQKRGSEISLAILDVLMPDMSGPELGRRFAELQVPAKLLFISGFAPQNLPAGEPDIEKMLLQKPFSASDLLGRVRQLIDA